MMPRAGLREDTDGVGGWAACQRRSSTVRPEFRSAVEMSGLAPFVDAAVSIDSTYWRTRSSRTTPTARRSRSGSISRCAIDRTARSRSTTTCARCGRARQAGRPGAGSRREAVHAGGRARRLAEVSGDRRSPTTSSTGTSRGARSDYARLLERAGLVLAETPRRRGMGRRSMGAVADVAVAPARPPSSPPRLRLPVRGSPASSRGDARVRCRARGGGASSRTPTGNRSPASRSWQAAVRAHKPGDQMPIQFTRHGAEFRAVLTLVEDPTLEVVSLESTAAALSPDPERMPDRSLGRNPRSGILIPDPNPGIRSRIPDRRIRGSVIPNPDPDS